MRNFLLFKVPHNKSNSGHSVLQVIKHSKRCTTKNNFTFPHLRLSLDQLHLRFKLLKSKNKNTALKLQSLLIFHNTWTLQASIFQYSNYDSNSYLSLKKNTQKSLSASSLKLQSKCVNALF